MSIFYKTQLLTDAQYAEWNVKEGDEIIERNPLTNGVETVIVKKVEVIGLTTHPLTGGNLKLVNIQLENIT